MRYLTIIFLFITTFATGQQQMFLRSTPAAGGTTGILDSYTGADAAYATALMYSGYSGSCLRVRRDSDNAEQNIGFSGQDIDQAAINSFCSGANCFVNTWYDQSGNGNNVTQATAANQPKIYDSVTGIIYENSFVALTLDGTNDFFSGGNVLNMGTNDVTVFSVTNANSTVGHIASKASSNNSGWMVWAGNSKLRPRLFNSGESVSVPTIVNDWLSHQINVSIFDRDGNMSLWKNSVFQASANISSYNGSDLSSAENFYIGRGFEYSYEYFGGTMQSVVIFISDQSANRTGIETAINNYYNIYP